MTLKIGYLFIPIVSVVACSDISAMRRDLSSTNQKMDVLTEELKKNLSTTNSQIATMAGNVNTLSGDVKSMTGSVQSLTDKFDQSLTYQEGMNDSTKGLPGYFSSLQTSIKQLKEELKQEMGLFRSDMNRQVDGIKVDQTFDRMQAMMDKYASKVQTMSYTNLVRLGSSAAVNAMIDTVEIPKSFTEKGLGKRELYQQFVIANLQTKKGDVGNSGSGPMLSGLFVGPVHFEKHASILDPNLYTGPAGDFYHESVGLDPNEKIAFNPLEVKWFRKVLVTGLPQGAKNWAPVGDLSPNLIRAITMEMDTVDQFQKYLLSPDPRAKDGGGYFRERTEEFLRLAPQMLAETVEHSAKVEGKHWGRERHLTTADLAEVLRRIEVIEKINSYGYVSSEIKNSLRKNASLLIENVKKREEIPAKGSLDRDILNTIGKKCGVEPLDRS